MKILEQGEWQKKITCRQCNSKLLINVEDLHYKSGTDYENGFSGHYFVNCLFCGVEIVQKNVPKNLLENE